MSEELQIKITAEISELKKQLNEAKKAMENTAKGSSTLEKIGTTMKNVAGTVAKVSAAAFAAVGTAVVAVTKKAIDSYAEYEQLVGGVETLFKDSASKVQGYANEAYKTAGMSANDYMSTVTSFSASLLQSLDGDTNAAAEAANTAIIDMADNANKMGTSMESITNAYQGFAKQNYTMLDNLKLGYGGTKEEMQRLLEDAEKISGIKYDISNLNDVYSAIHIVQTELGITGTTAKEAGSTIQGSAAAMKASWSNLVTGMADENADFDTLLTNFINSIGTFAENLIPRIEVALDGVVKLIQGLAPKLAAAIPQLVQTVLPTLLSAVTDIITSIAAALPSLIGAIVEVIPTLITSIVTAFSAIVESLPTIIQTIVQALPTIIPTLIDGVVGMIMAIIDNLSAIITPLIEALPDILIAIIDGLMRNLPTLISGIITLVLTIVESIPLIIQSLVDAIPTIVSLLIEGLLGALPQIIVGLIKVVWGVVKSLPQIFASLIEGIINIFAGIWDGLGKVFGNIGNWFKDKFSSAADGIKKAFSSIKDFFKNIWNSIKEIFSKIGSTIGNAITGAVKKAINGILSTAVKIINGFISAINLAIGIINAIPGVEIKKLSKLEVPKLAKGGIVDSATLAVVGERGREAVVPLENNTEWLDMLTNRLVGALGSSNTPVILQVDGKTFGEISVSSINGITRQTGSLPLVLA